jgi:hypothetical protein
MDLIGKGMWEKNRVAFWEWREVSAKWHRSHQMAIVPSIWFSSHKSDLVSPCNDGSCPITIKISVQYMDKVRWENMPDSSVCQHLLIVELSPHFCDHRRFSDFRDSDWLSLNRPRRIATFRTLSNIYFFRSFMIVCDHSRRAGILKMVSIIWKVVSVPSTIGLLLNFGVIRRIRFDHGSLTKDD